MRLAIHSNIIIIWDLSMLKIFYGNMDEAIYNTSVYFDNTYDDDWFNQDFTKNVIKSIDKGTVLGPNCIETKALGPIPPTKLAGGTKTILLIKNDSSKIFNASTCGDNCAPWILKIAKEKDITINLHHIMDFGKGNFKITILNNGVEVHNMAELVVQAVKFV